jgi:hypothetical protein
MNEELLIKMTDGSIHAIEPVDTQPGTEMTDWRLFQVRLPNGSRTRHLVGRADDEGRVCSALVHLDLQALRMRTQSGRIYELAGPPGSDEDSDYVFGVWLRAVGAIHCKDLTRALMRLRTRRSAGRRS